MQVCLLFNTRDTEYWIVNHKSTSGGQSRPRSLLISRWAESMFSLPRGDGDQGCSCSLPCHPHPLSLSASPFSPFWGHPIQMETLWLLVEASFLHKGDTGSIFCHSENISGILWNAYILLSLGPIRGRMSDIFLYSELLLLLECRAGPLCGFGVDVQVDRHRICAPRVTRPLSKSQRTLSKGTGRTRLGISRCALRHGYRCDWQQSQKLLWENIQAPKACSPLWAEDRYQLG